MRKVIIQLGLFTLMISSFFSYAFCQETESHSDFKSAVPHYTFPGTQIEQEEALKTNPLIMRFAKSREKLSRNPYRPIYHYVNPEGRLNDPNGFSYWNGNWHLFYQAYPPEDPRQHWGHAISKDLVHWRDLPYAIYPDPEKKSYSGSVLIEKNRAIAMYDGTQIGNMVAISDDPLLLNWEKLTNGPVIPHDSNLPSPLRDKFRVGDPFIWKKGETYYAIIGNSREYGSNNELVRANYLYKSKNLKKWEYMHPFVEGDRFTMVGDDGSCPYFWPIGDRYILIFFSHKTGAQYFLGDYDKQRDKFIVSSHGYFNHGAVSPGGVHAPSATPDGKGGVITIFNMNNSKSTKNWDDIMSLPMRLSLNEKKELKIEPAGNLKSLRTNHRQIKNKRLLMNKEIVFDDINGNAMEIKAEIDPKKASSVVLNVLRSPDKKEYTSISFYKNRGYRDNSVVSISTTYSSTLSDVKSRPSESAQFKLEDGENLRLHVFIDKSVIEVYINEKQYAAVRVYPGLDESVGVSMISNGGESELLSLDTWQMKNIWDTSLDEWHTKEIWK